MSGIKATCDIDLRPCENLKKNLVKKVIRKSVTKRSSVILKAAKEGLKGNKRTGEMFRSMGKKTKTYKDVVVAIIGPKSQHKVTLGTRVKGKNAGMPIVYKPSKIFHLVERGGKRFAGRFPLKTAQTNTAKMFAQQVQQDLRDGISSLLDK